MGKITGTDATFFIRLPWKLYEKAMKISKEIGEEANGN
jgi:hypothetical protein